MQYLKINRVYGILKTKVDSVIMLYGNEVIHMKCKDLLKNLEYECVRGSGFVEGEVGGGDGVDYSEVLGDVGLTL